MCGAASRLWKASLVPQLFRENILMATFVLDTLTHVQLIYIYSGRTTSKAMFLAMPPLSLSGSVHMFKGTFCFYRHAKLASERKCIPRGNKPSLTEKKKIFFFIDIYYACLIICAFSVTSVNWEKKDFIFDTFIVMVTCLITCISSHSIEFLLLVVNC